MMRRYALKLLPTFVAGALVAGCGSSGEPDSSSPNPGSGTSSPGAPGAGKATGSQEDRDQQDDGADDRTGEGEDQAGGGEDQTGDSGTKPNGPATTNGVDFGSVLGPNDVKVVVSGGNGTKMRVTNSSSSPVTITKVGVRPRDFRLKKDGCTGQRLADHRSCMVRIVYSRNGPGERVGSVTFETADDHRSLRLVGAGSQGPPNFDSSRPAAPPATEFATVGPKTSPSDG
jgi:hypothetical protein